MKMEDQVRDSGRGGSRDGNKTGSRRRHTSSSGGGADFNPADNLDEEARRRGGERSAQMQVRDERGHFAGKKSSSGPASGIR